MKVTTLPVGQVDYRSRSKRAGGAPHPGERWRASAHQPHVEQSDQGNVRQWRAYKMTKWSQEQVKATLTEKGCYASQRNVEHGIQFVLCDDTKVTCFKTGTIQVQGKDTELKREMETLFKVSDDTTRSSNVAWVPSVSGGKVPRVFIVYGHDEQALNDLELMLRRFKLKPVVIQNMPGGGDTIIEKLEKLTTADFACVLVTPDDEGRKRTHEADGKDSGLRPRARQNVVLELGMVLARLGRRRVAILVKGQDIERPSDIDGLLYISFSNRIDEAKNKLAAALQEQGFSIQIKDLVAS